VLDWGGGGTEGYMAPEQRDGRRHALGRVSHWARSCAICGGTPARCAPQAVCVNRLRAMGSDPGERYASPGELAAGRAPLLDGAGGVGARERRSSADARALARDSATPPSCCCASALSLRGMLAGMLAA
jgi:hypothetical protein